VPTLRDWEGRHPLLGCRSLPAQRVVLRRRRFPCQGWVDAGLRAFRLRPGDLIEPRAVSNTRPRKGRDEVFRLRIRVERRARRGHWTEEA